MQEYDTIVIGGGAAGICAAISAARCGQKVIICEKTGQIGKKVLATGNGRWIACVCQRGPHFPGNESSLFCIENIGFRVEAFGGAGTIRI